MLYAFKQLGTYLIGGTWYSISLFVFLKSQFNVVHYISRHLMQDPYEGGSIAMFILDQLYITKTLHAQLHIL